MKIRTVVDRPDQPQGAVLDLPAEQATSLVWRGAAVPVYFHPGREVPHARVRSGADA